MRKNLPKLQHAFSVAFQNDARGTLLNDMLAFEESDIFQYGNTSKTSLLPPEHLTLLLKYRTSGLPINPTRHVFMQTSVHTQSMTFSVSQTSHSNSLIIYRYPGDRSSAPWRAGKIISIFVSKQLPGDGRSLMTGPFFIVSDYCALSNEEASHDWYRKYGDAGGRLFHAVHGSSVLLSMRDIVCHFACTVITLS